MIDAAMPFLRCPVCEGPLARADERTLRCPRGHAFDLAKQGYASLTAGRTPHSGDTVEMVTAREDFLAAGHYAFIAEALGAVAAGDFVIDAGVGTGYYLAHVLTGAPSAAGLGLDVSKPALRRAARAHPRAAAVLADLWQPLPIRDGVASMILNVFAPRNGREFRRVLRPDGILVVVTPAAEHLTELITAYGLIHVDPDKAERVSGSLGGHFTAVSTTTLKRRLRLTGDEVRTLVGMTPSARHVDLGALPADDVEATAAVEITLFAAARR
jgi:23S rRNA (guanine745-N1)-methyltransferase